MNENFMKEEPVLPLITSMALPMVISMMVNSLYNIVDSFFVAQISEEAMTALSLVFPVQNFINAVSIGFGVGINALIAYYLGAGNAETANRAAVATGIGQIVTLLIYLFVYTKYPLRIRLSRSYLTRDFALDFKLYAIGIPATLNLALPSLLVSSLNTILAAFSQSYIVVLGIYYKLQTFLYLPANGIIQGMRPLIGFNYGAGEHERVKKIYNTTLVLNAGIMLGGTIICLTVPDVLMAFFTNNNVTVEAGAQALRIICAGFIVSAVSVTACGALEGLGKGVPSLVISLLRYVVIIIPAAWLLSRSFGAQGVWHAFWLAELVTAAAAQLVYKRFSK